MLQDKDRIFTNLYGDFGRDVKSAKVRGDWKDTKEIIAKGKDWIINEVKLSELRGRRGAGFPTGMKWEIVSKYNGTKYVAVNGDEGEPGTFKDRKYLETDPHRFLEGALIASLFIKATNVYIYMRDEYPSVIQILNDKINSKEFSIDPKN